MTIGLVAKFTTPHKISFNDEMVLKRGACELTSKISGEVGDVCELEDSAKDPLLT